MSRNPPKLPSSIMMLDPSLHVSEDTDALIYALDALRAWHVETGVKERSFALVPASAQRVLDVGSGTGDDVLALAERLGPEALVVGLDTRLALVEEATRRARVVALNVRFAVGDARYLPFGDCSFDAVRADGLFQDVPDARRVVRELARVLAPGGALLIHDREDALRRHTEDDLLEHCRRAGLLSVELKDSFTWRAGRTPERGLSFIGLKPDEASERAELAP